MASEPITGLPAAAALTGTDPLVTVQSGITVKSDVDAIKAFIDASPTMTFKGQADASAVDEEAATGTSIFQNGDVYRINVASAAPHAFSGISEDLLIGDWVVFNGTIFQKQDGTDPTAAETKTAYESNADTNAFTDAAQTKLGGIEALADVTDTANVDAAGAVMETDYNAQTVLLAVADDTPLPVIVAASSFVGRKAAGDVGTMTDAEARTVLNVEDGAQANTVASVFGRTDTVVAATSDYDAVQVDNTPAGNIVATNVQAAIDELDTKKLANIIEDTTPQLGGNLDAQNKSITDISFYSMNVAAGAPSYAEGNIFWDGTDQTLAIQIGVDDVVLQVGQEIFIRVRNTTGSTITNGQAVYISGVTGNRPQVTLAKADIVSTSDVIALATHDIENNSDGYVTTFGLVRNLNTSVFTEGDILYLSAATAGEWVSTAPGAPNILSTVGRVTRSSVAQGVIFVDTVQFSPNRSIGNLRMHSSFLPAVDDNIALGSAALNFSNLFLSSTIIMKEITTPATPATGDNKVYFKSDGKLYTLEDDDTERKITVIIGTDVQAWDAVLDATTASFLIADETKLGGIAAGAQVNTVDDVFGRTGNVVAVASDYDASQIDNDSSVNGLFVDDALNRLLSEPWTLNHVISKNNFSTSTQSAAANGIFITADGLKMYVTDFVSETIYQYTLSTAWDVSTASYDSKSFAVTTQAANAQGVWLSPDGTTMFVPTSDSPGRILEYDLSTPFDVSTASFTTSLNVSAQTTTPKDIFFRADGKKMYTTFNDVTNNPVLQYSLTIAYDISTASYDSVLFNTSAQTATIQDVFFKDDGLKMFVSETNTGLIFQYTLSTAWNVSTAVYDNISFDTLISNQGSLFFKAHGATFYVATGADETIESFEVAIQNDNPYTDTEKIKLEEFVIAASQIDNDSDVNGLFVDDALNRLLSEPWTLNNVISNNNFDLSSEDSVPSALFIRADGLKMYVGHFTSETVYQYTLSTAWDISSASFDSGKSFAASTQLDNVQGVWFSLDGLKMFLTGSLPTPRKVYEYDLSVAWDVSTAVHNAVVLDINTEIENPRDIFFRADGLKMFIAENETSARKVNAYTLTVAYDLSTASFDSVIFDVSAQTSSMSDVFFKDDGLKMFVADVSSGEIFQYTLSTAWDISTASYDNIVVDIGVTSIGSLFFKEHGATLYIVDSSDIKVKSFEVAKQDDNLFTDIEKTKLNGAAELNIAQEWTKVQNFDATDLTALGDDLVTNGAFAADTDWTKGTGWTIASGVASSDGTQAGDADLTQALSLVSGQTYEVEFTVSNYSAGNVTPVAGDVEGTDRAANGTFTENIVAGAGGDIDIRADLDFIGDIDDVTVRLANVSWDLESNQVTKLTLDGNLVLDNPTNLVDGAIYVLTLTQDGVGTRTLSYGSVFKFPGGTVPTLSTGVNDIDIISFVSDGTNMYGIFQGDFS